MARPERLLTTTGEATVTGLGDADILRGLPNTWYNGVLTRVPSPVFTTVRRAAAP